MVLFVFNWSLFCIDLGGVVIFLKISILFVIWCLFKFLEKLLVLKMLIWLVFVIFFI